MQIDAGRQAGRRGREVAQLEDSTIICIECQAKASKKNYKNLIGSINDETSLAIEQKNPSQVCIEIVAGQTKCRGGSVAQQRASLQFP